MIITQMGDGLSPFFNPKTYMGREKMADEILNEENDEQETGMVTLSEAKAYLRVDSSYEDPLITSLLASACSICMDVGRLTPAEWSSIADYTETNRKNLIIQSGEYCKHEILCMKEILRVGVFYTLGYLYEHREEADHHDLVLTLRNLLFSVREGVI